MAVVQKVPLNIVLVLLVAGSRNTAVNLASCESVSSVQQQVTTASSSLSSLQSTVNSQAATIAKLTNDLNALGARVSQLEGQADPMTTWLNNAPTSKPNVLFLVVDDLRPWLGCYGTEFMVTPNIDQLAGKSVRFDSAYCQHAICNPSRASFMTGRRTDSTHVMDLATYWRDAGGNFTTVSQYFKDNGYIAEGIGKIFHRSQSNNNGDYPYSWSSPPVLPSHTVTIDNEKASAVRPIEALYGALKDTNIATQAVEKLQQYGQNPEQEPFFLAVGFHKPHLPFLFPSQYMDLYPEGSIPLAQHRDLNQSTHRLIWTSFQELRNGYDDIKALNLDAANNYRIPDSKQEELRRGYAAATSYIDAQVGRVLQALTDAGLGSNTIVTLHSDHGFQLGENGQWCKHNNYETSVRVPLMVRVPGVTDNNDGFTNIDLFNSPPSPPASTQSTPRPVELVDLFPTLAELAGLTVPTTCPLNSASIETCVEGASLVPLIREATGGPSVVWKDVAFSQYPRNVQSIYGRMGYTLRTRQYRYTEWVSYDYPTFTVNFDYVFAKELYLHDLNLDGSDLDPEEHSNEVDNPVYSQVVSELADKLHENWYTALNDYNNQ